MDRRDEIIALSGQIINGIMSSDESVLSKLLDRGTSKFSAEFAVDVAFRMLEEIDKKMNNA